MKKLKILILGLICLLFMPGMVDAASGSISVSGTSSAVVGNRVTLTVTLSSGTSIGSWQMDLNYDRSYLQLVSSTAEAGGTSMVNSSASGVRSKSYTFVFKTLKTGNTRVSVSSYLAYAYSDLSQISLTSSSKSIRIMTQEELEASYSKDNNLKSLNVTVGEESYEIDPEFSADVLEYNVTVPTGTTMVNVEAVKNDSKASVDGAGEVEVTEGLNTIPIVVTAQNGDEKTYTLIVNVEDQNPINVVIDGKNYTVVKSATLLSAPSAFSETTVQIDGFDIPAFVNDAIGYTLVGLKDEDGNVALYRYLDGEYSLYNEFNSKSYILVPVSFDKELDYIKTTALINGVSMDVYKYSEDSNLVIINAINLETGKEDLYLYDPDSGAAIVFDESFIQDTNQTIEYYTYIIIAFGGALLLMLIVIFVLLHSTKKKQKKIKEFILKQEAKIEATRKLNDVVDEVKKTLEEEKSEDLVEDTKAVVESVSLEEENSLENSNDDSAIPTDDERHDEKLEEPRKSKKELKKEKKEAKRKLKEEKKLAKKREAEEVVEETQVKLEDEIKNIENPVSEETSDTEDEVYDIFEDDRKKKKKKKK